MTLSSLFEYFEKFLSVSPYANSNCMTEKALCVTEDLLTSLESISYFRTYENETKI